MSSKKNEKNEIILQKENEKIQNNLNKERKDNNKIFIGQKNLDFMNESSRGEIEEIKMQLIKEKDKNKKLEDKIKILERDLTDEKNKNKKSDIIIVNLRKELDEKNKNKKSDIIIVNLRKELDNEIKKYNDMIEQIEEDKIARKKLEKETKDSFLETIIEKDKKIKDLELKITRFPFTLEKGEKLMTIIFITPDQKLHYSVICKNTEEFHKIEGQLYKEYPEYTENENYFILNGKKINKYKTLEQNGINIKTLLTLLKEKKLDKIILDKLFTIMTLNEYRYVKNKNDTSNKISFENIVRPGSISTVGVNKNNNIDPEKIAFLLNNKESKFRNYKQSLRKILLFLQIKYEGNNTNK